MKQPSRSVDMNVLYFRALAIFIGVAGVVVCGSTLGSVVSFSIAAVGSVWLWIEVRRIIDAHRMAGYPAR